MRALIQLGIVCAGVDAGAQGVSSRRSNALFKQAVQESFGQFQAAPMRPHIDTAIQLNFFLGRHGALGGVDGAVNLIRELRGQGTADGKNLDTMVAHVHVFEEKVKELKQQNPPSLFSRAMYYVRHGIK